jgi:thiosulfate/3-mercaptopyruvate sulfurtransferase
MLDRSPLVSAEELLERVDRGDERLRIVDTRWSLAVPGAGAAAYAAGHLPGSIHLDLDGDLADPGGYGTPGRHPLPSPAAFAARLARRGIGDEHLVVAYDDVGGWVAARLWWMLDVLGHHHVAVLDGGIDAWTSAGGRLTTEVPSWPPSTLHLADAWTRVISRDELKSELGSVVLLDARAAARYRGEVEPIDPVAGHIPGAVNLPLPSTVDADGRLRPRDQLRATFAALGAPGDQPVGAYCGSGITAAQTALALYEAGYQPALYVGSWSDWITDESRPRATGDA